MRWGLAKLNNDAYTMTDLLDDFFRLPVEFKDSGISMKMDVHEDEKAVYVKAELPGLDEKDLNVSLQNNILTISGEKKEEKTEEDKRSNYYYCERSFGSS
jgi:HSP20 family protein